MHKFVAMADEKSKNINLLWQSFQKGNDKSFVFIYNQFAPILLPFGYRFNIDRELVHDALQEVFIDLYLRRERQDIKIENLKAYLFVAMRNNLLKQIDKTKKNGFCKILENDELLFHIEYSFQDQLIKSEISMEQKSRLQNAITNLSSKQKEIVFLKFEEDLNYHEISKIMNITIESARKQLYRAIKNLRELLDSEMFSSLLLVFSKNNKKNCPYPSI